MPQSSRFPIITQLECGSYGQPEVNKNGHLKFSDFHATKMFKTPQNMPQN